MHVSHRQEAFSVAYVRAVAAVAGFRVQEGPLPDDDSVDLTVTARGPGGTIRSPCLDLQLKCRLGRPDDEPEWSYDLKAKNYDDLRHRLHGPANSRRRRRAQGAARLALPR